MNVYQQNVSQAKWRNFEIPLPPLATILKKFWKTQASIQKTQTKFTTIINLLMLLIIDYSIFKSLELTLKIELWVVDFRQSGKRQMLFQFKESEMILLGDYHRVSLHLEWSEILKKFISDKTLKKFWWKCLHAVWTRLKTS